ncbi:MAG: hypothetical protein FD180_2490 [Planctomycetota bacterium]|nr:MAG: hypothetical protein FD180_2490 [Planctomycetota bacterium]
MPVAVPCASCNTALEVDLEHVGWRVRCPKCDSIFVARSSTSSPPLEGGGAPSPFAQTWTPPGAGRPADATTPPTFAPGLPPAAAVQPSLTQPTGSFNEIFSAPIQSIPGARVHPPARTAFILGILSIACFHLLTGIPAVLVGYKARHKIRGAGGHLAGDNLALAGIVMGAIGIVLTLTDWTPWSFFKVFRDPVHVNYNDGKKHR